MMAVSQNEHKVENCCEIKIGNLIKETTVLLLEERQKSDVLEILVDKAVELGLVTDVPVFKSAIDAREALCATAIGDEIAIPHAKIPGIPAFFVMTAVMRNGVEWDAPDQKPVRIVFLIGGPDNDQKAYLGLLGKILKTVKNADRKECLFRSGSTAEIASILTQ